MQRYIQSIISKPEGYFLGSPAISFLVRPQLGPIPLVDRVQRMDRHVLGSTSYDCARMREPNLELAGATKRLRGDDWPILSSASIRGGMFGRAVVTT
jgi:hypothetical protein